VLSVAGSGRIADLFRTLADPTRLRIIGLLAEHELCVTDLSAAMQVKQPAVSQQLRSMRQLGLVTVRREGRHSVYALADAHVRDLFERGREHIECSTPRDQSVLGETSEEMT
jgi:DNA-binding transcriptional ArsR family regulator